MRILTALIAALLLIGCQAKLSQDQIELLAAVAYITYGMEEGNNKFSSERVDRQVHSDEIEYLTYSKSDEPADMHMRVRNPSACVFTVDTRGDGKGYVEKLDFNQATKFEFGVMGFAYVTLTGPKVYCKEDRCEDDQAFLVLEQRGEMSLPENREIAARRMRAIDFIKKSCPGKPF
jgi:hypothetical protein